MPISLCWEYVMGKVLSSVYLIRTWNPGHWLQIILLCSVGSEMCPRLGKTTLRAQAFHPSNQTMAPLVPNGLWLRKGLCYFKQV